MTRFRRLLALGSAVAAATLALGVSTSGVSAKGSSPGTTGYTMDAYGTLHPLTINGTVSPSETAASAANHAWTFQIARSFAEATAKSDGLVLDGFGGLHGWGTNTTSNAKPADPTNGPYFGWDIARSVALMSGSNNSGYVLDGWGGIHPFGTAPAVTGSGYWSGWDIARGLALNPTTTGGAGPFGCDVSGVVLDGWGGLHPFTDMGSAGDDSSCLDPTTIPVTGTAYWPNWDIAHSFSLDKNGKTANAGYVMDGYGALHGFCVGTGCSLPTAETSGPYWNGWDVARGVTTSGAGTGYILDAFGGVHGFDGLADPGTSGYNSSSAYRAIDLN